MLKVCSKQWTTQSLLCQHPLLWLHIPGTSWCIHKDVMYAIISPCFCAWQTMTNFFQVTQVLSALSSVCSCCTARFAAFRILAQASNMIRHAACAGWSHFAQFTIAVVNKDPKKSKYSGLLSYTVQAHDLLHLYTLSCLPAINFACQAGICCKTCAVVTWSQHCAEAYSADFTAMLTFCAVLYLNFSSSPASCNTCILQHSIVHQLSVCKATHMCCVRSICYTSACHGSLDALLCPRMCILAL